MNDLTLFDNGEFHLEVTPHGDSFRVLAPGLAKALGFREAFDLLRNIPEAEKGSEIVRTPGGDQRVGYVTEPGFYRALGQRQAARIPQEFTRERVERFQSWVYGEVLPSIRKTGSYSVPSPRHASEVVASLTKRDLAEMVIAEADRADAAEKKARALEPAALSWAQLAEASGDYSLREAAQILDRDPSIHTGQNRLAKYLREIGWADKSGEPYQRQVDLGRLVRRSRSYDHPVTGEPVATVQVRVTVKGIHELHRLLGGSGPLLLSA